MIGGIRALVAPYLFWIKVGLLASAIAVVFGSGWKVRDAFCDAAEARAALQAEITAHAATKQDLDAARLGARIASESLEAIEAAAAQREETIRDLEHKLGSQPACRRLDGDGLRWLHQLAPD